ncbi:hypothetical protein [Sneathiella glossodoripedis]|uniref:hypothetical protein n=1 Tax=Sneathiella glossodoripedis TaxID=418853 RepID=UPI00046EC2DC|nr:hypothetical protein [Sneathiella glossodoripedis]
MNTEQANRLVARTIAEAMNQCKNMAVDEQTLRTGLLTITLANFVNRIGKENTINLFEQIPNQIRAGTFDKYIDPETNTTSQGYAQPAPAQPHPPQSAPAQPTEQQMAQSYRSDVMPSNFIPPQRPDLLNMSGLPQRPAKRRLKP